MRIKEVKRPIKKAGKGAKGGVARSVARERDEEDAIAKKGGGRFSFLGRWKVGLVAFLSLVLVSGTTLGFLWAFRWSDSRPWKEGDRVSGIEVSVPSGWEDRTEEAKKSDNSSEVEFYAFYTANNDERGIIALAVSEGGVAKVMGKPKMTMRDLATEIDTLSDPFVVFLLGTSSQREGRGYKEPEIDYEGQFVTPQGDLGRCIFAKLSPISGEDESHPVFHSSFLLFLKEGWMYLVATSFKSGEHDYEELRSITEWLKQEIRFVRG